MDSSMIGKIEKAMFYAQEPDRVTFNNFQVAFDGDHTQHHVTYNNGDWHCSCHFFESYRICSHVMALERILAGSVQTADSPPIAESIMISKIEKSILYAGEIDRLNFISFTANIQGDHKTHKIEYHQAKWSCDCKFFKSRGVCSHTMALERLLPDAVKTAEGIPVPA